MFPYLRRRGRKAGREGISFSPPALIKRSPPLFSSSFLQTGFSNLWIDRLGKWGWREKPPPS